MEDVELDLACQSRTGQSRIGKFLCGKGIELASRELEVDSGGVCDGD